MGMKISASNLWVTPSSLTMERFKIKNPPGFNLRTAFTSKEVLIDYNYSDLKDDPSYIEQILFDHAFISIDCIDQDCSENNWKELAQMRSSHKKNYTINRIIFQDLTIEVLSSGEDGSPKKVKTIPYLELSQVSSKQGFPTNAIFEKVFESADLQRYSQDFPVTTSGKEKRTLKRSYRRNTWYKENH